MTLRFAPAAFVAASVFACPALAADFTVSSTDVKDGAALPMAQVAGSASGMGCTGGNISPALSWTNAPAGTKSFAVSLYDPDAPTGSGFWHWVVYNIPETATGLAANAGSGKGLPKGAVHGPSDAGLKAYLGACPPPGMGAHHYVFTVKALDLAKLPLPATASPAMVGFVTNAHTLAKATITATYGR